MSDVVGKYFKAWAGPSLPGSAVYYCDSYDPAVDFWMTPVTRVEEGCERTAVSPRAIGRTYHEVYPLLEGDPRLWCQWGRLTDEEISAIEKHRLTLA